MRVGWETAPHLVQAAPLSSRAMTEAGGRAGRQPSSVLLRANCQASSAGTETVSGSAPRRAVCRTRRSRTPRHGAPRCPSAAPYHFASIALTAGVGWPARVSRSHFLRSAAPFGTDVQIAGDPRQPLVELRHVRVQHVDLLLDHIVDRHGDVGAERIRPLEAVLEVHEDRVLAQAPACRARCSARPPCRRRPARGHPCSDGRGDSRSAAAPARGRRSTGESGG